MELKAKVGYIVWYVVQNHREQARLVALNGCTHAFIQIVTGAHTGQQFEAPWGIIEPMM